MGESWTGQPPSEGGLLGVLLGGGQVAVVGVGTTQMGVCLSCHYAELVMPTGFGETTLFLHVP